MDIDKYLKYKTKYYKLQYFILNNNEMIGGRKLKNKQYTNNKYNSINNNMTNSITQYNENLSEPWFTLISLGLKTIEGRKNKGRFKEMQIGDIITWTNNDFLYREIKTRITGKASYTTFEEYLNNEGLDKCLPGISNMETGLSVYFKYFTKEDEQKHGVIAIKLEIV